MKNALTIILIGLPALLFSPHVLAFGCVALSADVQVAVRDKDSPPPKQRSEATHLQGENCFANKAVVINKQIAVAESVPEQSANTLIIQDTPANDNPLKDINIASDQANISKHIAIQIDVPVPYNKLKHQLDKIKH